MKSIETCGTLVGGTPHHSGRYVQLGDRRRHLLRRRRTEQGLTARWPSAYHPSGCPIRATRSGRSTEGRLEHSSDQHRPPMSIETRSPVVDLVGRSNRLGSDPRNTNFAGGNASAKGSARGPGDRPTDRAALGQGLRWRSRHADRGGTRGPPPRPAAGPRRRLSRRGSRGRDGRGVRPLPVRQGRRRAVDRHRDARPRRRRPTSTTSTPTRGSRSRPRPTARR